MVKIDDNYLFEDNIRRYFLKEMLSKKVCLKTITIEELDNLVSNINTLISNLNHRFKNGKKMIDVSDENNWEGDTLFRDIILHNVLDITPTTGGTTKDFKEMLKNRWEK